MTEDRILTASRVDEDEEEATERERDCASAVDSAAAAVAAEPNVTPAAPTPSVPRNLRRFECMSIPPCYMGLPWGYWPDRRIKSSTVDTILSSAHPGFRREPIT